MDSRLDCLQLLGEGEEFVLVGVFVLKADCAELEGLVQGVQFYVDVCEVREQFGEGLLGAWVVGEGQFQF